MDEYSNVCLILVALTEAIQDRRRCLAEAATKAGFEAIVYDGTRTKPWRNIAMQAAVVLVDLTWESTAVGALLGSSVVGGPHRVFLVRQGLVISDPFLQELGSGEKGRTVFYENPPAMYHELTGILAGLHENNS